MRKMFLSLVVVLVCTMSSMAQTDLVATLSHGSNLTTYTGYEALAQAYNDAVDGDIITLSSGAFKSVNIEKALTLRGAGMSLSGVEPTTITNTTSKTMTITIPDNATSTLTIEGITFSRKVSIVGNNLSPIHLFRCRFDDDVLCEGCDAYIVHCILASALKQTGSLAVTVHCLESVIYSPSAIGVRPSGASQAGTMLLDNCIVLTCVDSLHGSTLSNCIIWVNPALGSGYITLPSTSTAYNCVSNYPDTFTKQNGSNNTVVENIESLFKTLDSYSISNKYTETFELTNEAAATYLGNDGTQVGIYGGASPFSLTPTNPQVKNFTVNSTTNNGKLSVKINVE